MERLRREARRRHKSGESALQLWWSKKYSRPPNDPLYYRQSRPRLFLEWLTELWSEKEKLEARLQEADSSERGDLLEMLESVNIVLGVQKPAEDEPDGFKSSGDPLADEWERQLLRGEMPDLDKLPDPRDYAVGTKVHRKWSE